MMVGSELSRGALLDVNQQQDAVQCVASSGPGPGYKTETSEGLIMSTTAFIRLTAIRFAAIAALTTGPVVLAGDPPPQYAASCGACHAVGVAGAPATGDAEAWAPRMEKGMDALVASVRNGLNAMPPGGLCNSCSDDDYAALITYMATAQ